MDDRLVLFAGTVAQSKLSKLRRLLSRIFRRIDLDTKNERSIGKTNKCKIWIVDKDCGLWTGTAQCGLILKY